MKKTIFAFALLAAAGVFAETTISVTRAAQRYPWNGLVDIDYTVSGIEKDPVDYMVALTVTLDGTPYAAQHFLQCAGCDLPTADGTYRVTWDAQKDGAAVQASSVSVKGTISHAPVTEKIADYVIIDVSSGKNSTCYPIRYVRGADIPTDTFNVDLYKTTKIVLKCLPAQTCQIGQTGVVTPVHYAKFTHPFFMGLFEITQSQYSLVVGKNPSGHTGGDTALNVSMRPVEKMNWVLIESSDGFIQLLNARTRYHGNAITGFQLPTEAQWECTCRAGTTTKYFFGETSADLGRYAWYSGNATTTMPVGLKEPNPWGFYDMCGNVVEWVYDSFKAYTAGVGLTPETAIEDPLYLVDVTEGRKIMRGGSRRLAPESYFPSAYRQDMEPTLYNNYGGDHAGFRISKTLD